MKLAHISPGAGGMYCGSCMHDNTLASALIKLGHEVALIPIYTPVRTDETDVSIDQVFYGAPGASRGRARPGRHVQYLHPDQPGFSEP